MHRWIANLADELEDLMFRDSGESEKGKLRGDARRTTHHSRRGNNKSDAADSK